jgi:hypothetical protein
MNITIEHNVPLPPVIKNHYGDLAEQRKALSAMQVGDSFFYSKKTPTHLYLAAKQVGVTIVSRKLETGGWRIWRTADRNQLSTSRSNVSMT